MPKLVCPSKEFLPHSLTHENDFTKLIVFLLGRSTHLLNDTLVANNRELANALGKNLIFIKKG